MLSLPEGIEKTHLEREDFLEVRVKEFAQVLRHRKPLARNARFGFDPVMSTKERAIAAIDSLPVNSDMGDILREIAFITGTDEAREEMARGEGMDATEAKAKLRAWING